MKQQENSPAWKGSPRLPELAILKAGAIILFRHDVGKRKEEVRDLLRRGMENRLSGKPLLEVESVRSFSLRGVNSYILNVVKGDEREGILAAEYIIKEGNRILNVVKGDEREGILAAEYIIKEGNRILNVVKGDEREGMSQVRTAQSGGI